MTSDNLTMTRRQVLATLGLAAFAGPAAFGAATKKKKKGKAKGKIALQLYTMRDPAKADLLGTLKKCREMGWEYVQWSGMPVLPAEKIREALDAADLKAIAAHIAVEDFEAKFDENVKFWKTVGCKDIAPGGMMNDCKKDLAAWLQGAKRLDTLGGKLHDVGMRLSYHNHTFEMESFPGDPRRKLDILMETAKNVNMELDVAWAFEAGVDPAAQLRKYPGRCPVIHIKDIVRPKDGQKFHFEPLGQGEVNWKEVFAAGKESGVEWFVYEQDAGVGSPFDYAKASFDFLKKNGF